MNPHERAMSVWYRVAGLLRQKDLAIDMIEWGFRSAQQQALMEASDRVTNATAKRTPVESARAAVQPATSRPPVSPPTGKPGPRPG